MAFIFDPKSFHRPSFVLVFLIFAFLSPIMLAPAWIPIKINCASHLILSPGDAAMFAMSPQFFTSLLVSLSLTISLPSKAAAHSAVWPLHSSILEFQILGWTQGNLSPLMNLSSCCGMLFSSWQFTMSHVESQSKYCLCKNLLPRCCKTVLWSNRWTFQLRKKISLLKMFLTLEIPPFSLSFYLHALTNMVVALKHPPE